MIGLLCFGLAILKNPDSAKIGRWMRWFVGVVAIQGTMQVAIFVVMAKFATGL